MCDGSERKIINSWIELITIILYRAREWRNARIFLPLFYTRCYNIFFFSIADIYKVIREKLVNNSQFQLKCTDRENTLHTSRENVVSINRLMLPRVNLFSLSRRLIPRYFCYNIFFRLYRNLSIAAIVNDPHPYIDIHEVFFYVYRLESRRDRKITVTSVFARAAFCVYRIIPVTCPVWPHTVMHTRRYRCHSSWWTCDRAKRRRKTWPNPIPKPPPPPRSYATYDRKFLPIQTLTRRRLSI